jgi:hypothetical protein
LPAFGAVPPQRDCHRPVGCTIPVGPGPFLSLIQPLAFLTEPGRQDDERHFQSALGPCPSAVLPRATNPVRGSRPGGFSYEGGNRPGNAIQHGRRVSLRDSRVEAKFRGRARRDPLGPPRNVTRPPAPKNEGPTDRSNRSIVAASPDRRDRRKEGIGRARCRVGGLSGNLRLDQSNTGFDP